MKECGKFLILTINTITIGSAINNNFHSLLGRKGNLNLV